MGHTSGGLWRQVCALPHDWRVWPPSLPFRRCYPIIGKTGTDHQPFFRDARSFRKFALSTLTRPRAEAKCPSVDRPSTRMGRAPIVPGDFGLTMRGRPYFCKKPVPRPNYARNSPSNRFLKHVFHRGKATESPAIASLRDRILTFLLVSPSGAFAGLFVSITSVDSGRVCGANRYRENGAFRTDFNTSETSALGKTGSRNAPFRRIPCSTHPTGKIPSVR